MKQKKKNNGFTLVELLTTILLISIVLGIATYSIINTLNKSKDESKNITYENLMTGARIYVQENQEKIIWKDNDTNINEKFTCISVKTLVNQSLIEKDKIEKYEGELPYYIIVTKNNNGSIVSEKADTNDENGLCKSTQIIDIPTSDEVCKTRTYDPATTSKEITEYLTTLPNDAKYSFTYIGTKEKNPNTNTFDAGTYEFKVDLEEGHIWEDGTTEDKAITCTIKKATPSVKLEPTGEDIDNIQIGTPIEPSPILTTDVPGKIIIKPSNPNYIEATVDESNTTTIEEDEEKEIIITPLATREIENSITITLIPEDTTNYYSSSVPFIIGKTKKIKIPIPTEEKYCSNPNYNGNEQLLIKNIDSIKGFSFDKNTGTDVGTYPLTASLKYGYIWDDGTTTPKTINCNIAEKQIKVTYNSNGGTTCNPNNKNIIYSEKYGELCLPQKSNYLFLGWYTSLTGGTKITADSTVTTSNDHTLYARWKEVSCTINYSGTLGKNGWYTSAGEVTLTTSNMLTSEIKETNVTTNSSEPFTKLANTTQEETAGTTWYGSVKDINDHTITCQKSIKVDKTPPTDPIIDNPSNGEWTNKRFSLTLNTTENLSGMEKWQYRYNDKTTYNKYSDSNLETYETPEFTDRDYVITLRACDQAGNCSNENSTNIKIDTIAPTTPVITNENANTWVNTPYSITATTKEKGSGIEKWLTRTNDAILKSKYTTSSTTFTSNKLSLANAEYKVQACDVAGNCSNESITNIKVDTIAPVITSLVNPTNETWTNQPFALTGNATEEQSGIAYWQYKYAAIDWQTYNNSAKTSFVTTDYSAERNELTYLRVCDKVGNCSEEKSTWIKIDKTAPEIPTIIKSKDELPTTPPLYLDVSSEDPVVNGSSSGLKLWYYKYDKPSEGDPTDWTPYPNSQGQTTFTTSGFSKLRNDYVNIRVCDVAGNCSQNKTQVYLVETVSTCSESNPTACQILYICKSAAPDEFEPDHTFIRNLPSFNSTQELTLWTGSPVYKISETEKFYYVYVGEDVEWSTQNKYYNLGRYGYIYKGCLRTSPPSETGNWCTETECSG